MNNELSDKLYAKYGKYISKSWWWGFECGDGWFDLIDETLSKIIDWYKKNNPDDLENADEEGFVITQIKEKYGELRIYIGGSYPAVFDIIEQAEKRSRTICELCGKVGECKVSHGWYKTVCEEHWNEWNARYDKNTSR